jgi:hypothetical protein
VGREEYLPGRRLSAKTARIRIRPVVLVISTIGVRSLSRSSTDPLLTGAWLFLLLSKILAKSKQFQLARKIAAEDAAGPIGMNNEKIRITVTLFIG